MLLPILSEATIVNKPLNISVENCYSVDITVELEDGKESPIGFVGCTKESSDKFHCDCLNKENENFSIVMRTDNVMVRDIRYYDVYISAKYFDTFRKTMSVDVEDGGEYYEQDQKSWRERSNKAKEYIKVEYVNTTIYEDRIVEVTVEKIVYEDKIVNVTVVEYVDVVEYIENATKVNYLEEKVSNRNYLIMTLFIGLVIFLVMLLSNVVNKNE